MAGADRDELAHLSPSAMSAFTQLLEDERTHLGHHGIDALDPDQPPAVRRSICAGGASVPLRFDLERRRQQILRFDLTHHHVEESSAQSDGGARARARLDFECAGKPGPLFLHRGPGVASWPRA